MPSLELCPIVDPLANLLRSAKPFSTSVYVNSYLGDKTLAFVDGDPREVFKCWLLFQPRIYELN